MSFLCEVMMVVEVIGEASGWIAKLLGWRVRWHTDFGENQLGIIQWWLVVFFERGIGCQFI